MAHIKSKDGTAVKNCRWAVISKTIYDNISLKHSLFKIFGLLAFVKINTKIKLYVSVLKNVI